MASIHPWRDQSGGDGLPPIELYKAAIDEYRFQVSHNWSRIQYLLAFNVAILTAGVAVTDAFGAGGALVFFLGAISAGLSAVAVHTQHDYYRAARDRMRQLEDLYGVPEVARVNTTATLGERRRPAVSVTQVVYLLLGVMALADVVGIVFALVSR